MNTSVISLQYFTCMLQYFCRKAAKFRPLEQAFNWSLRRELFQWFRNVDCCQNIYAIEVVGRGKTDNRKRLKFGFSAETPTRRNFPRSLTQKSFQKWKSRFWLLTQSVCGNMRVFMCDAMPLNNYTNAAEASA